MAGSGDIKAGGAYIEIGANTDALDKALKNTKAQIQAFATDMTSIGMKLGALDAGLVAPMVMAVKAFADAGEAAGKFATRTGMSTQAASALVAMAGKFDVPAQGVQRAVKSMQLAIGSDSKEMAAAFAQLGVSAEQLKAMTPEDAFATLADRLNAVTDFTERLQLGSKVLGMTYQQIAPLLEAGSEGMNQAGQAAAKSGKMFDKEAAAKAEKLDQAFKSLANAAKQIEMAIGSAIADTIIKVADSISDCADRIAYWIEQNPAFIDSIFNAGIALSAIGPTLAALGVAISAALSPVVMMAVGFVAIAAVCLALTDTLGLTKTGFGDLFDSIRVDGTGLATWFGVFATETGRAWEWLSAKVEVFAKVYQAVLLTAFEYVGKGFYAMVQTFVGGLNVLLSAFNALPEVIRGKTKFDMIQNPFATAQDALGGAAAAARKDALDAPGAADARMKQYDRLANQDNQRMLDRDAAKHQNSPQNGVDTSAAWSAVQGIGENIRNAVGGMFANLPNLLPPSQRPKTGDLFKPTTGAAGAAFGKPEFSAVGSFSGSGGGNMAASGVFASQLVVQREMATHLKAIKEQGGGGAVAVLG